MATQHPDATASGCGRVGLARGRDDDRDDDDEYSDSGSSDEPAFPRIGADPEADLVFGEPSTRRILSHGLGLPDLPCVPNSLPGMPGHFRGGVVGLVRGG